jgi:hypothetical protein
MSQALETLHLWNRADSEKSGLFMNFDDEDDVNRALFLIVMRQLLFDKDSGNQEFDLERANTKWFELLGKHLAVNESNIASQLDAAFKAVKIPQDIIRRLVICRGWPTARLRRQRSEPLSELDTIYMHPIMRKGFGVAHMVGNVREWTMDVHYPGSYEYRSELGIGQLPNDSHSSAWLSVNPVSLSRHRWITSCTLGIIDEVDKAQPRLLRGGSFSSTLDCLRCAYRDPCLPRNVNPDVGFRCVLDF